ncbi:MAG: hypothetical protein WA055_04000 [Candidatus Moraniibacteriota bacterium]
MGGSYNVAFRYTMAARGYSGVITWTSFVDKQHFDNWLVANPNVTARQEVVEEGITQERALELVHQTPFKCYLAANVQESITHGKFDFDFFLAKTEGLLFTRALTNPDGKMSDLEAFQEFSESFLCILDTILPLIVPVPA